MLLNLLPLLLHLLRPATAQRGPLPFNWTTTYAAQGIPFDGCKDATTHPLLNVSALYASGCDSSPCTVNKATTPTLTLLGHLRAPVGPNATFSAYAWETDIVYWVQGDADFCAMLLPGRGASLCPLPAGNVTLRFKLPPITWNYDMDAQLELRVAEPSGTSVVCLGMHMWYRVPEIGGSEGSEGSEATEASEGNECGSG